MDLSSDEAWTMQSMVFTTGLYSFPIPNAAVGALSRQTPSGAETVT
jgi:hypothetical protein